MKSTTKALIAAAALVIAGQALANDQTANTTREQVQAQVAQATRSGDVDGNGFITQKLNETYPSQYPAKVEQAGKTRAQVQTELAEATRTGDIDGNGLIIQKLNETYPDQYPAKVAQPGKTRAQVQAELTEAMRTGNIDSGNPMTHETLREANPALYPAK